MIVEVILSQHRLKSREWRLLPIGGHLSAQLCPLSGVNQTSPIEFSSSLMTQSGHSLPKFAVMHNTALSRCGRVWPRLEGSYEATRVGVCFLVGRYNPHQRRLAEARPLCVPPLGGATG